MLVSDMVLSTLRQVGYKEIIVDEILGYCGVLLEEKATNSVDRTPARIIFGISNKRGAAASFYYSNSEVAFIEFENWVAHDCPFTALAGDDFSFFTKKEPILSFSHADSLSEFFEYYVETEDLVDVDTDVYCSFSERRLVHPILRDYLRPPENSILCPTGRISMENIEQMDTVLYGEDEDEHEEEQEEDLLTETERQINRESLDEALDRFTRDRTRGNNYYAETTFTNDNHLNTHTHRGTAIQDEMIQETARRIRDDEMRNNTRRWDVEERAMTPRTLGGQIREQMNAPEIQEEGDFRNQNQVVEGRDDQYIRNMLLYGHHTEEITQPLPRRVDINQADQYIQYHRDFFIGLTPEDDQEQTE